MRTGVSKSAANSRFLKLSDNPFSDDVDEEDLDDESLGGDEDEFDDGDMYPEEDDDMDYDDDDDDGDEGYEEPMNMAVRKGRSVSGPRTKLMKRFAAIEKAQAESQALTRQIAKAMTTNSRAVAVLLSKMDDFDSKFTPYGDEEGTDEEYHEDDEEGTMNEPGLSMSMDRVKKGVVRKGSRGSMVAKDDAASAFGEKDDDIVGNRHLDPDNKGQDAEMTLINGGPSDGPGPVSKAAREAASVVLSELQKAGVLPSTTKKARSPQSLPTSVVNKAEDDMVTTTVVINGFPQQFTTMKAFLAKDEAGNAVMSERNINSIRELVGDLPSAGSIFGV